MSDKTDVLVYFMIKCFCFADTGTYELRKYFIKSAHLSGCIVKPNDAKMLCQCSTTNVVIGTYEYDCVSESLS